MIKNVFISVFINYDNNNKINNKKKNEEGIGFCFF